jgi:hypothetical protein
MNPRYIIAALFLFAVSGLANSSYPGTGSIANPTTRATLAGLTAAQAASGTYQHMYVGETGYQAFYDWNASATQACGTASFIGVNYICPSDSTPPASGRWVMGPEGSLLTPSFPALFPTSTAIGQYVLNTGSYPSTGLAPMGTYSHFLSEISIPTSYACATTPTCYPTTNYSGYIWNAGTTSGQSAANFFGVAQATATTATSIGTEVILSNTNPSTTFSSPSNTGFDFSELIGVLVAPNVRKKSGSVTPSGRVEAIKLLGNSNVVPSTGAYGMLTSWFSSSNHALQWTDALHTDDGITTVFARIGKAAESGASSSQSVNFCYNNGSVGNCNSLYASSDGSLVYPSGMIVGSSSVSLDSDGIAIFHVVEDSNLEISGPGNLGGGVVIHSLSDGRDTPQPMELVANDFLITATTLMFNPSSSLQINGTTAVSCSSGITASTVRVVNGIVTHC